MNIEKTEEQIAKEKAAVEAMRNAKANMDAALARITDLERSLAYALDCLKGSKNYISASVYSYPVNSTAKSIHALIDDQIAQARRPLG